MLLVSLSMLHGIHFLSLGYLLPPPHPCRRGIMRSRQLTPTPTQVLRVPYSKSNLRGWGWGSVVNLGDSTKKATTGALRAYAFFVESGFSVPGRVDTVQDFTPFAPVGVDVSYIIWPDRDGLSFFPSTVAAEICAWTRGYCAGFHTLCTCWDKCLMQDLACLGRSKFFGHLR